MKLSLLIGLVCLAAVQAEIASTEDQGLLSATTSSNTNTTTDMTSSTSAWDGPVNITEPTPGTKWEAGSLHTVSWMVLNHNGTDNSTTGGNSTNGHPGNNSTDGGGHGDGDGDDDGHGHGDGDGDGDGDGNGGGDGGHGNDTDTNHTQIDHLSIQLAGGNFQAVDLAHNVSKSDGQTQILIPPHLAGGKNFTLAVSQPGEGVSSVSGIDIENDKNGTHDKNGSVNPDINAPTPASSTV